MKNFIETLPCKYQMVHYIILLSFKKIQFMKLFTTAMALVCMLFISCKADFKESVSHSKHIENGYEVIQEMLLDATPGSVVEIPEGMYMLDRSISLDGIRGVTIRGMGKDKTILSFKGQSSGAEGLRVTADSVTLMDFTIADAKGDAIKLQDCHGVMIKGVKTTWTDGAKATNGAYGLYPVQCEGVTIDSCEASFASDAGIYVGQSRNVVVKNSYAHHNVAGIAIENCVDAQVFNCLTEENTGGLLVFDLPDLELVNGNTCKLYNNIIRNNNFSNFASEGNMVAIVPPGTGIILLAAKKVEVYDNLIEGHKTIGIGITSFHITQLPWKDERYDPYTYDINIHNNTIKRKSAIPDLSKDFGKMVNMLFPGKPQDILYDGILKKDAVGTNPMNICIKDNEADELRFANIDASNDFDNVNKSLEPYACL